MSVVLDHGLIREMCFFFFFKVNMLVVLAVVGLWGAAPPKIRPRGSFVASYDPGHWIW